MRIGASLCHARIRRSGLYFRRDDCCDGRQTDTLGSQERCTRAPPFRRGELTRKSRYRSVEERDPEADETEAVSRQRPIFRSRRNIKEISALGVMVEALHPLALVVDDEELLRLYAAGVLEEPQRAAPLH
jgi:hypothetical protein